MVIIPRRICRGDRLVALVHVHVHVYVHLYVYVYVYASVQLYKMPN